MCALLFVLFDKTGARGKSVLQNYVENEIARKRDRDDSIFQRIVTRFSKISYWKFTL
jgi:hypothetical protein